VHRKLLHPQVLNSTGLRWLANPRVARAQPYRDGVRDNILSLAAFDQAKREITSWPGYNSTPLRRLSRLAARAGLSEIPYKDEAERFGILSFKALGGAYAVFKVLQRHILATKQVTVSARDLASGGCSDLAPRVTVTCATDGNHGRSVAWGARTFGCACVIYMPDVVSAGRSRAIEVYGAQVRRLPGTFDDAVRKAASDAAAQGWHVVSDTSADGSFEAPRDVMQGYCLIADEALSQCAGIPSHVFVQGGVGGLAAATCAYLWERCGAQRPRLIVVEPHAADCILRSVRAGRPTPAEGALDSIMGGLSCGEVSRSPGRFSTPARMPARASMTRPPPIACASWPTVAAAMLRSSPANRGLPGWPRCCSPAPIQKRARSWASMAIAAC
jgi:diaminopropionate ammonia-lyase